MRAPASRWPGRETKLARRIRYWLRGEWHFCPFDKDGRAIPAYGKGRKCGRERPLAAPAKRSATLSEKPVIDADAAWSCLLALREAVRAEPAAETYAVAASITAPQGPADDGGAAGVVFEPAGRWHGAMQLTEAAVRLLDLYAGPAMASCHRPLALGHIGQSLDGRIATESGRSHYITGPENIVHLHRLRALCDAVIVGAGTVMADDPRLTTRRVAGPNPVRVVIDPDGRLPQDRRVFADGAAPTLRVCAARAETATPARVPAKTLVLDAVGGELPPASIVAALHAEGLFSLFVEGGGVTLSRFLAAGALDRLQVAVAPLVLGSGRPSFTLPVIEDLGRALRPTCRSLPMGDDVLFDCDLRQGQQVAVADR